MIRKIKNILIVAANQDSRNAEKIKNRTKYNFYYLDLAYSSRNNEFNFDILAYLDKAREYIKKYNIHGVFYHLDIGSLIAARLCDEFNLPGPSLESIFLAYNKYYTRMVTNHAIIFDYFNIFAPNIRLNFPFYLKAPCSSLGVLGYVIANEHEFKEKLKIIQVQLPAMTKAILPLIERYIDIKKYPLATKPIMMIEKLTTGFQITVEGFVYNNKPYFTVITDTNNFSRSQKIDNFSMPSRLTKKIQEQIKQTAQKDIKAIGLNNSFFNCEYWIDNNITLIEINGRAATAFYHLYKKVYHYDVFEEGIKLCLGQKPTIHFKPHFFGGQFNIVIEQEGKSQHMIYYDKLPSQCKIFIPSNTKVTQFSQFGRVIAQVELFGKNYTEIKKKADKIRKQVMKEVQWNKCFH